MKANGLSRQTRKRISAINAIVENLYVYSDLIEMHLDGKEVEHEIERNQTQLEALLDQADSLFMGKEIQEQIWKNDQ